MFATVQVFKFDSERFGNIFFKYFFQQPGTFESELNLVAQLAEPRKPKFAWNFQMWQHISMK
jgi:hypothetical protein